MQPQRHRQEKCVRLGGQRFLKFLEVKNDCLVRIYSSNNVCFIRVATLLILVLGHYHLS